MIILGLTGSVGMGKSTAAAMLRKLGVPVHDSDAVVHRLLGPGGAAVTAGSRAFPKARRKDGGIDRVKLGQRVWGEVAALARLVRILWPLVRQSQQRFLKSARARREKLVVLVIPLLFESGGARRCDLVAVVSAPAYLQRARVMGRPGMTEERFRAMLRKQMPDAEKRRRADVVIPSGLGRAVTFRRLARLVERLRHPASCVEESPAAD